jgi:pimeloyl-ACP methyl ester carboxylesterase
LSLSAKEVDLKLPDGIVATAEYRAGKLTKPAVLILHGNLQSRNFPLVYNLAEYLSGEGYPVLTPTLSLGISNRSRSLPCEAIHTHTMQGDVDELRRWINWLKSKGHKHIVLIGHSFGTIHLLSYAMNNPATEVNKLIFISPIDMESNVWKLDPADKKIAENLRSKDKTALGSFKFGFCKQLHTPADAYLSYLAWNHERILQALTKNKIPIEIIFGDGDTVIGKNWPEQLRNAGARVSIISNASHFFEDSGAEFELFGKVGTIMSATPDR